MLLGIRLTFRAGIWVSVANIGESIWIKRSCFAMSAFAKIPYFRITNNHEISPIGYSKFAMEFFSYLKSLFPKPTSTPTCYSFALLTSLCKIHQCKSHKIYFYCGLLSFDIVHNVYKVFKSGKEWHAGMDRRGFGTKQDFMNCFSLCMFKLLTLARYPRYARDLASWSLFMAVSNL